MPAINYHAIPILLAPMLFLVVLAVRIHIKLYGRRRYFLLAIPAGISCIAAGIIVVAIASDIATTLSTIANAHAIILWIVMSFILFPFIVGIWHSTLLYNRQQ
jgi:hypothetical protein